MHGYGAPLVATPLVLRKRTLLVGDRWRSRVLVETSRAVEDRACVISSRGLRKDIVEIASRHIHRKALVFSSGVHSLSRSGRCQRAC